MTTIVSKPQAIYHIHTILPRIKIYHKLDSLLTNVPMINIDHQSLLVIAIENKNNKRHFTALTFDQLLQLFAHLEPHNRTLYEVLCQNNFCKLYFDFDVFVDNTFNFDFKQSLLILQNLFHYIILHESYESTPNLSTIEDHFLVLSASTKKKHSYHLIYTNTTIRFESQKAVLSFIMSVLHHCSRFIITHTCQKHTHQIFHTNDIKTSIDCQLYLETILTHTHFCDCSIPKTNITCENFQKLLYTHPNGSRQWVFDLHVYKKNQQFRLYKSTKYGKQNHLLPIPDFPFNQEKQSEHISAIDINNHKIMLLHSLISYKDKATHAHIIKFSTGKNSFIDLNTWNAQDLRTATHQQPFNQSFIPIQTNIKSPITKTNQNTTELNERYHHYKDFILKLITETYNTNGYIQSCVQGTTNRSLNFYNISGSFRFCERIQRHHKSNQSAIIVDTFTNKYQIKCKDPDCRTFKPPWKSIIDSKSTPNQ